MNNEKISLSKYRLEKARQVLKNAILDFENDSLMGSVNRSYYAIFHSMRAVLELDGFDSKKHSGIIAYFREKYVKSKKFDSIFSDYIRIAFEIRNDCDYEDFYVVSIDEVDEQIINATCFMKAVEEYLVKEWENFHNE